MFNSLKLYKHYLFAIFVVLVLIGFFNENTDLYAKIDEPLFYTIQIGSFKSREVAGETYLYLEGKLPPKIFDILRLQYVSPFYALRLGKFKDYKSALIFLDNAKKYFPDTALVRTHFKKESIIKPAAGEVTAGRDPLIARADVQEPFLSVGKKTNMGDKKKFYIKPKEALRKPITKQAEENLTDTGSSKLSKTIKPITAPDTETIKPKKPRVRFRDSSDLKEIENKGSKTQENFLGGTSNLGQIAKYLLLGLILASFLAYLYYKKTKAAPDPINRDEEKERLSTIPGLSQIHEKRLAQNTNQLSIVEGNIIGANRDIKTIYVTSCFNSEGKTISSISIAHALATSADRRVLLIDGNPRSPKIHKLYGTKIAPGLMDFLYSEIDSSDVFRDTKYENLTIMTFGSPSFKKTNHLDEKLLKDKLSTIKNTFDFIIFDGDSMLASSNVSIVANNFDGTIIAIVCEKTKWEVVQMAIEKADMSGENVLGVVLNKRKYYIPKMFYGKI